MLFIGILMEIFGAVSESKEQKNSIRSPMSKVWSWDSF